MRKNYFRRVFGLALAILMAGSLAVSCYDDSELRASIDDLKTQLSQLQTLVSTLQNDDAVTGVTQNADGSYTINFKKSGAVTIRNGKDGKDGKDGDPGKDGNAPQDTVLSREDMPQAVCYDQRREDRQRPDAGDYFGSRTPEALPSVAVRTIPSLCMILFH